MKDNRIYLWLALFFFLLLLVGRAGSPDVYAGPEALLFGWQAGPDYAFPAVARAFGESAQSLLGRGLWAFRFPVLFLALGLLLLISALGRVLFGESRKNLLLAVFMSSFGLQFVSWQFSGDLWLLTALIAYGLTTLLQLKRPSREVLGLSWFFLVLALWVAWVPALVASSAFWLLLRFGHPFGKSLAVWHPLLPWLGALLLGFSGLLSYEPSVFFMALPWRDAHVVLPDFLRAFSGRESLGLGFYLLLQFVALLPWLGFLVAGLYELSLNLRRREEMALVSGSFLLAGVLSFGLLAQWAFALLIARQLEGYVKKNYPYENLVKGFAILQLVLSFALVFAAVFFGALAGSGGFAALALKGLLWWGPSVIGVLGLFMKKPALYVGGPLFTAFLVSLTV